MLEKDNGCTPSVFFIGLCIAFMILFGIFFVGIGALINFVIG